VPAKINLSLGVGPIRDDGYHALATVYQALDVYDEVRAVSVDDSDDITVSVHIEADRLVESIDVPTDDDNLAVQAAKLLRDTVGAQGGARLAIRKVIPVAGGMAGGSADAAAALLACDALWRTGVSRDELCDLAAELGSDVPFPLTGHTAIGTGRGHLLTPAMVRGEYHWAFAVRDQGLSTARVFATFDELISGATRLDPDADRTLMQALRAGDAPALGRALHNDLQHAALELAPSLAEPLAVAEDAGALGVLVSGSGPTVAALARSRQHALVIAAAITAAGVADDVATAVGPVPGARIVPAGTAPREDPANRSL
jgi:4-diphosphocytidyl-2-C-methyl-D-erythritol kinase